MAIPRAQITGLVLAGGRGSRMGGIDKGLALLQGRPLVAHAIERLAPQVGPLLINANRHLERYAAFGHPVVADAQGDYPGPLAGMLAGLQTCVTPWLVTVPCDSPRLPTDLVARLAGAVAAAGSADTPAAEVAIATTRESSGRLQHQPVCALLHASLVAPLAAFLAAGERRIDRFTSSRRQVVVEFDDDRAFFNANTPADLAEADPGVATMPPAHTFEEFSQRARANGFDEVLERRWDGGVVLETHTHPFGVVAQVVQGRMWLTVGQSTRELGPGETFELDAGVPHAETYGPEGAAYWVGRRYG